MRSAHAVAFVTIPSYLYNEVSLTFSLLGFSVIPFFFWKESIERCIHSADIAMKLQSFTGTELESNQSLQDYHGFFYLTKLAAINSLASKHPGSIEYVFKLRRKKFCIEVLHLPPDIGDSNQNQKNSVSSLGCGGTNKHMLDF